MTSWKQILENPTLDRSVGIPDDRTLLSGKLKAKTVFSFIPAAATGAGSNTHSSVLLLRPHPAWHLVRALETGTSTGNYTDLSGDGAIIPSYASLPNMASLYPTGGSAMVRMVAAQVRVQYQGTELNRAGRYYAGLASVNRPAKNNANAPNALSPLSAVFPSSTSAQVGGDTIKQSLQCLTTERVSDQDFVINWKPAGVPAYNRVSNVDFLPWQYTTAGALYESSFACNAGGSGTAYGDSVLVLMIENDYVPTAATAGNLYNITVDSHWEVVPDQQYGVVYPLTPSPYDPAALQRALNSIDQTPVLFRGPKSQPRRKARMVAPRPSVPKRPVEQKSPASWRETAYVVAKQAQRQLAPAAGRAAIAFATKAIQSYQTRPRPSQRRIEL